MSGRTQSDADVDKVVVQITGVSKETLLREMTKTWSVADFDFATDRLAILQPLAGPSVRELYRSLRRERGDADARASSEEANARRHAETVAKLQELKRPHWSIVPNFWMTALIVVLTAIGAIAAVLALRR